MIETKSNCPVCDAQVRVDSDIEVSEVIMCAECKSKLVITNINTQNSTVTLEEAPEVEEDWGQ